MTSLQTRDDAGTVEIEPQDPNEVRPASVVHPPTRLAGPEGHPFHPILVTLPIGAWVSSMVFDIGSRLTGDSPTFGRGGMWLLFIGVAGALLAAIFGLLDLLTIPRETPARATGTVHMILNLAAVAVFFAEAVIRYVSVDFPFETPWWAFAFSSFGLVCIAASGYLGGRLAYHFGIRVAGRPMQAEGFVHTDDPGHVQI